MITPIVITIFSLLVLLFSVVIHELAHGYVANSLGDPTAKYAGRLTLNPLKHLDPFGSVLLPLMLFMVGSPFMIGWAKPVPVNPYNLKDQKWGSLKVSIAGPITNFSIAVILGLLIRFLQVYPVMSDFVQILGIAVFYNLLLGLFNLIPIPPLDGSWVLFSLLPRGFEVLKVTLSQYGVFILIFFIFFGGLSFIQILVVYLFALIVGVPIPFF